MTGNFAFGGIDMALWDLCGKECGQPLYRLLGGAMRDEVDYFYYMEWGTPKEIEKQCKDGVARGYQAYYIKVGVDEQKEEAMLEALRGAIGPEGKLRIDVNQAYVLFRPQARESQLFKDTLPGGFQLVARCVVVPDGHRPC